MSNKSEQSEFILEKILGLKNMQEKLENCHFLVCTTYILSIFW